MSTRKTVSPEVVAATTHLKNVCAWAKHETETAVAEVKKAQEALAVAKRADDPGEDGE